MRDETRRFVVGISLIAVLVLGLFFWSRSKPASTPPLPPSPAAQEIAHAPAPKPARRIEPAQIGSNTAPGVAPRVSTISSATAGRGVEPALTSADRIPFPRDLARAFTASGFHEELARVIADCKFPYEISEEDCTEFPCIAWGKWKGNNISPDDCAAFHETFGSKDFVFSNHRDAEGNPLVGLSMFPPSFKFGRDEITHLRARTKAMSQTQADPRQEQHRAEDPAELQRAPALAQLTKK